MGVTVSYLHTCCELSCQIAWWLVNVGMDGNYYVITLTAKLELQLLHNIH